MNKVDKTLEFRHELRRFILGWFHPQTLASESARKDLNDELKERWKPNAIEVYELVRESCDTDSTSGTAPSNRPKADDFIVFIDKDLDVDWINNAPLDQKIEKSVSYAESIGAKRCKHMPREQILEFKRLIGQAIVNAFQGATEQSISLADGAAQFLKQRTVERSRSWTLVAAHVFLVIFSAVLILCCNCLNSLANGQSVDSGWLCLAIQGGIFGAYLSTIQKAGRGEWDAAAGRQIHYIEVFTKLFAGGVLGGIAFALSRSVHAPPSLKAIAPDGYSLFIFSVAAGLFERLIPKMISTYTKSEKAPSEPNT
ncbi:MAG: hypothetical protein WCS42_22165 [Verrucomicrobiota bacterium]